MLNKVPGTRYYDQMENPEKHGKLTGVGTNEKRGFSLTRTKLPQQHPSLSWKPGCAPSPLYVEPLAPDGTYCLRFPTPQFPKPQPNSPGAKENTKQYIDFLLPTDIHERERGKRSLDLLSHPTCQGVL